jgi:hypothetical protein
MAGRTTVKEVLLLLGIDDPAWLDELRREGLFEEDFLGPESAEELRVAITLVRELGVNPAGVEVILQMRRRMLGFRELTERSLRRLLAELDGH